MLINIINGSLDGIRIDQCYSLRTTYLSSETFQILFFNSVIDFYSCEVVSWSDMKKNEVLSFDRFLSIMAVVFKLWIYFL